MRNSKSYTSCSANHRLFYCHRNCVYLHEFVLIWLASPRLTKLSWIYLLWFKNNTNLTSATIAAPTVIFAATITLFVSKIKQQNIINFRPLSNFNFFLYSHPSRNCCCDDSHSLSAATNPNFPNHHYLYFVLMPLVVSQVGCHPNLTVFQYKSKSTNIIIHIEHILQMFKTYHRQLPCSQQALSCWSMVSSVRYSVQIKTVSSHSW